MQVDILRHDVQEGTARIQFKHRGVTHTQDYDLLLVVPGTKRALEMSAQTFTLEMQNKVIEKLTAQVEREIEEDILHNPI